jgi:hypothetical protein
MAENSYHRYPSKSVRGDYFQASIGILFFGLPFLFTDLGIILGVILGALTIFFIGHGARTLNHQISVFELTESGLVKHGPLKKQILWERLSAVKLRYFSTVKDRPRTGLGGGWMEMTLNGDGAKVKFDSGLGGFEHLARTIEKAATDHDLRFDESTEANFRALRGDIQPDDSDDPRDKTPYPDNYRGPGI